MSLLQEIRELPSGRREVRKFAWTVGGVLLAAGAFFIYRGAAYGPAVLAAGGVLAVVGSVLPAVARPLYYAWMSLALALGFVATRVLLTVFFFLILTPVGLLFKLIGRDPLHRKLDRGAASYWIDKEYPIADRSRYEKFF